jgi:hypothetical protein
MIIQVNLVIFLKYVHTDNDSRRQNSNNLTD